MSNMSKLGKVINIKARRQCITLMEQYQSKSVEEIRLEDYVAGRNSGAIRNNRNGEDRSSVSSMVFYTDGNRFGVHQSDEDDGR